MNIREFRQALLIDTSDGPRVLDQVMDLWQRRDFGALDSGWMQVAGLKVDRDRPVFQRGWLERARGHSKTSDQAVMATWATAFSKRRLTGICAAADKDQSRLLRDSISRLADLNPWLGRILQIDKYVVTNKHTGSTVEIISSDSASSYGLLPDFVLCDEIVHWKNDELCLFSSIPKRQHALLCVITNAGFADSWQWRTRELVREDPNWFFSALPGCVASWIDKAHLDEQRRQLPELPFRRLWENIWSSGAGDAISEEALSDAIKPWLEPTQHARQYCSYVLGLDLATKRDRSAACVLGYDYQTERIFLCHVQAWEPGPTGVIDLMAVEADVARLAQNFGCIVGYDPYAAASMMQRLEAVHGVPTREVPFVPKNLVHMAAKLVEVFQERQIDLFNDQPLLRDLRRLMIVERSYGLRLEASRDSTGHADRATAFAIALPFVTDSLMVANPFFGGEQIIGNITDL